MQYVTLVNRTSKNLVGTWNGRQYTIAPGKHEFPEAQANKFKEQNPVMGSEHPYTLEKQYLCGIVEYKDDISPIEQTNAVERIDRSKVFGDNKNVTLVSGEGLYSVSQDRGQLPNVVGPAKFENPDS